MLSSYSIGVELAGTQAFMVCLEKKLSGIHVKSHSIVKLDQNHSFDQHVKSIEPHLLDFMSENAFDEAQLYFGFPRDLSILKEIELPLAAKDDIYSTITYSLDRYLPIKLEDLYFDCAVFSENKQKKTIKVLMCAAKKSDLRALIDLSVSLNGISGVQAVSTAVTNYAFYHFDVSDESCSLFFADDNTFDFSRFSKGIFNHSRSFRLGENDSLSDMLTEQIQGSSLVHLCGSGITDLVCRDLESRTQAGIIKHDFKTYDLPSPKFIPSVGLALNGFVRALLPLNLLPEEKRKKISNKAKNIMYALTGICMILGIVWGGSSFMYWRMTHDRLDEELSRLKKEVLLINQTMDQISGYEEKIDTLNSLKMLNIPVVDILKEVSRKLPSGSWVKSFSYNREKGARVMGYSDSSSDLIPLFEQSDLFKNAVFLSPITKGSDDKERFNIGFEIRK